jgi:hypothetical protein
MRYSSAFVSLALGLGALAAIGGFTPGVPAARAAPSVSLFAGTYAGAVPPSGDWSPITVSDSGGIQSSYDVQEGLYRLSGALKGKVLDDGTMSLSVTMILKFICHQGCGGNAAGGGSAYDYHVTFSVNAHAALDASGNLLGTTDAGAAFTWYRQ